MLGFVTKKEFDTIQEMLEDLKASIINEHLENTKRIEYMENEIEKLKKELAFKPKNTEEYMERVLDAEIKLKKLYQALIEYTPSGKEKLTKMGKAFGGKSKHLLS